MMFHSDIDAGDADSNCVEQASSGRRSIPGRLVVVAIFVAIGAVTCSAAPKPKPSEESSSEEPIRPENQTDRNRFEDALEQLEAGNYEEARRSFRLFQSERSGESSSAQLAELYAARAELGPLEEREGGEATSDSARERWRRGARALESLRSDDSVDPRIRRAASLYWAWVQIRRDRRSRATSALASYRASDVPTAILEGDRPNIWPVLVEGLHGNGRWERTLDACVNYYGWLVARSEETESAEGDTSEGGESTEGESGGEARAGRAEDRTDRRGEYFEYVRARAFEAASHLSDSALEKRLESEESFLRATAGWAYLERMLDREELSEEQRASIDERYSEVAADLNAVGASSRVSELSVERATLAGNKRLILGALVPLSGSDQSVGRRAIAGMLLAMRAFEHRGPSQVTLVFQDANGEPEPTLDRLKELGVSAVVGPLDRKRAADFAPVASRLELPLITLTATDLEPSSEAEEPWVLRNFMNPVAEARAVARLAFHEYGDRRAAVLHPDVGYGNQLREAFVEEFRDLGGQVVSEVPYDPSASDFSAPASTVAGADPDTVFIPDSGSNVAELTAFLAERDVWGYAGTSHESTAGRTYVHYLGTSLWQEGIVARQAGKYVEGAVIPAWYSGVFRDDASRSFGSRFRGVHGRKPSDIEAFAFDNIRWLRKLMLERGLQGATSIRDALLDGAEFQGATGTASFDESGRLRRQMRFITVRNEQFEPMTLRVEMVEQSTDESGGDRSGPASGPK